MKAACGTENPKRSNMRSIQEGQTVGGASDGPKGKAVSSLPTTEATTCRRTAGSGIVNRRMCVRREEKPCQSGYRPEETRNADRHTRSENREPRRPGQGTPEGVKSLQRS